MEAHDRIAAIVRTAEDLRKLGLRHALRHVGDFCRSFAEGVVALFVFGNVEEEARLFKVRAIFFPGIYDAFERGLLFEDSLGFFGIVPKIGLGGNLVQLRDPLLLSLEVKDASGAVRVALPSE
jgi:hypothetical protein